MLEYRILTAGKYCCNKTQCIHSTKCIADSLNMYVVTLFNCILIYVLYIYNM